MTVHKTHAIALAFALLVGCHDLDEFSITDAPADIPDVQPDAPADSPIMPGDLAPILDVRPDIAPAKDLPVKDLPVKDLPAKPDLDPTRCIKKYGAVKSFKLCSHTPTQCRFLATTDRKGCTDLCSSLGGKCVDGQNEQDMVTAPCTGFGARGCALTFLTQICTCSL